MTKLQGRSIALIALSGDLTAVAAAIEMAGGEWQAFSRVPSADVLRVFDAIVCHASAQSGLQSLSVPLLVIGSDRVEGANDFVLPPVRPDEVVLRLARLLDGHAPRRAQNTETPVVLTADDDPTTTAIIRAVMTANGMTCHVAHDGREAFELARSVVPHAIVLDVNMPFRDGFEVLTALRGESRTASIPVLMLTSVQQEADVVKGFRLGADDYVVKPFNPMELLARVKRLVRRA
jgi:CheY-like chemotaxis protein